MASSSLTGKTDHTPSSVEDDNKKSVKEDDLKTMEDDWGGSPGTKELFTNLSIKYVGLEGRNMSLIEPGTSSTTPTTQQEDGKRLVVPEQGTPIPNPSVGDEMSSAMCRTRCNLTACHNFIPQPLLGGFTRVIEERRILTMKY